MVLVNNVKRPKISMKKYIKKIQNYINDKKIKSDYIFIADKMIKKLELNVN